MHKILHFFKKNVAIYASSGPAGQLDSLQWWLTFVFSCETLAKVKPSFRFGWFTEAYHYHFGYCSPLVQLDCTSYNSTMSPMNQLRSIPLSKNIQVITCKP